MSQDTVNQILTQINQTCRNKGGKYAEYSCETVSWDDVQRGTVGGNLSCWGANITDTYLNAKDGRRLFTVRSDNWNEKLGHMTTKDIALVQGNQNQNACYKTLSPITLKTFLEKAGEYGKYAKLDSDIKLDNLDLDQKVSVRFQTTFLPVENKEKSTLEFCTEAYNYNTRNDDDPRNLILLCTTQGMALQQDGAGTKKIYHHNVDERSGEIERYWLEAERSAHKVGGQQVESKEEKEDAIKRGKATSSVIGIKAMGTRFNVLMTVQIPLEQQIKESSRGFGFGGISLGAPQKGSGFSFGAPKIRCAKSSSRDRDHGFRCAKRSSRDRNPPKKIGTANAARVSRGTKVDTWSGLNIKTPKRNKNEHITCTIVIYNTITDGVPSENDITAAIDDMENLYNNCNESGRLADSAFDFMKSELTVKDVIDIKKKIVEQPVGVEVKGGVEKFDQFPE